MIPEPLRDPCSYYDSQLKDLEAYLAKLELSESTQALRSLVTILRSQERARVQRIIEQI